MEIITGYTGKEHVTAYQDGRANLGTYGVGEYVLEGGKQFQGEIVTNNMIKILDGFIMMQGRFGGTIPGDFDELTIKNGVQGKKRHDLIVARYEMNQTSSVESMTLKVVEGVSGDIGVDPEYVVGNLSEGDIVNEMPLYRVKVENLNVVALDPLFQIFIPVQKKVNKSDVLTTTEAVGAVTKAGYVADALVIKALNNNLATKSNVSHAAPTLVNGGGTGSNYGHVKLSDNYEKSDGASSNSVAASSWAVWKTYDVLNTNLADTKENLNGQIKSISSGAAGNLPSGIFYLGANVTGVPAGAGGMLICSEASTSGNKVQIFYSISTEIQYEIYKRTYNGTTSSWTSWYALGIVESRKWHAAKVSSTFAANSQVTTVTVAGIVSGCPIIANRDMPSAGNRYIIGSSASAIDKATLVLDSVPTNATTLSVNIMYYC